jgi:N-acetylmuramoyl-L-alanine amidase
MATGTKFDRGGSIEPLNTVPTRVHETFAFYRRPAIMRPHRVLLALIVLALVTGGCSFVRLPDDAGMGGGIGWGGTLPPVERPAAAPGDVPVERPAETVDGQPSEPVAEAPAPQASMPRPEPPRNEAPGTSSPRPEPRPAEALPTEPRPEPPASAPVVATSSPAPTPAPAPTSDVVATSGPSLTSGPSVTRVSLAERSDGRGYVVRLHTTGPVPAYKVEEVQAGRLTLTLFQTGLSNTVQRADPRGPIRQYALHHADGRAVLTIDLEAGVHLEAPRAYPDRDSHDLLLALTYAPPPRAAAQASAPAGASAGGADAASLEHWRLDCIVIDPGHGGRDPGAVYHGVREKDVTLGIALRLGRLIEQNLGVRVVYTRRDDRFVELAERGRIANESCGKLFVSIHGNSAANQAAQGTETYFLGLHRSEDARRVMERENSVVQMESDPSLYSGMDDAALIMRTMAQSTYLRVSEQLASHIESQFASRANRRSRGVKQAGFLVLWRASMPAVLVETGFISNREEARFLASAEGQDLIAQSIYRAIREYKQQYERGLGLAVQ